MATEDFNSARLYRSKVESQLGYNAEGQLVHQIVDESPSAQPANDDTETTAEEATEPRTEPLTPKGTQVYNFLWLNLDMPPKDDPEDGSIREPLKPRYIQNVREAALDNPATDVFLWVDSKRLTEKQMIFLQESLEEDIPNVKLKDLRTIPAYDEEPIYNEAETNKKWRSGSQTSTIWRQVDTAKILITLQGNYDQSFFADIDHSKLGINSIKVQEMLDKHGLMIGASSATGFSVENQLWGMARSRRPFFESYYITALKSAYKGNNAWNDLVSKVSKELNDEEGISSREIILPIDGDGTSAEHTGHEFRDGWDKDKKPAVIEKGELQRVFNRRSTRPPKNSLAIDVTWAPSEKVAPVSATLHKRSSGIVQRVKEAIGWG